jgi:hypothetical protein
MRPGVVGCLVTPQIWLPEPPPMSYPIKREHAKRIQEALRPSLQYLNRLEERLIAVGSLPNDPLHQKVVKARDAMHDLSIKLHYLGCDGGVGEQ